MRTGKGDDVVEDPDRIFCSSGHLAGCSRAGDASRKALGVNDDLFGRGCELLGVYCRSKSWSCPKIRTPSSPWDYSLVTSASSTQHHLEYRLLCQCKQKIHDAANFYQSLSYKFDRQSTPFSWQCHLSRRSKKKRGLSERVHFQ